MIVNILETQTWRSEMARTLSLAAILLVIGSALTAPVDEAPKIVWGTFEDPDKDSEFKEEKGVLSMGVLGKDHDLSIERGKMNAPRAMQPVEGDFTVQVKVTGKFDPVQMNNMERLAYHGAGFFIRQDDNNYIRLDRATLWDGTRNRGYANFELRVNGQIERFGNALDVPLDNAKDTWIKIERKGTEFTAFVSQEASKWQALGTKSMAVANRIDVGVAAINSSLEPFAPRFSEFELKTITRARNDK
jgi:regulation of enolase protein 1 (concanavalin A-like superfamily)